MLVQSRARAEQLAAACDEADAAMVEDAPVPVSKNIDAQVPVSNVPWINCDEAAVACLDEDENGFYSDDDSDDLHELEASAHKRLALLMN